ncbi:hypothetical protein J437_LFUL018785 [Ladona fulva]|uniref:Titin n=1 Tax=Ladona fulva TaxID=123851 RepID=A0A8K0KR07_LADFU|nr:hypothetical protein J437_LFUL018785 [Ladona fulva]
MRWVPVGDCNGTSMRVDYLIEGHDYNFRVKAVNKQGESLPLTGTSPITAKDPFGKPEKPGTPEPVDWDRDHVDLQWTPPKKDGGSPITSYIIEKRTRFGPWEKAAEVPGNVTKGTAPNLIEGEEYEFRVIAVNKGGPGEPSEASKPVIAKPRFQAPVMDTTFLQDLVVRAGQRISYNIPIEASPRPKVTWTVNGKPIAAGTRADIQTFEKETVFEIPFSVRSDTGKYTIKLENDLGFCSASAHVTVLDRPSPPQGPMVISDITKEGAHLSWKIPADDGGSPILHYVIEKMDLSRGTWSDAGMSLSLSHDVIRLIHRKEYLFRVKAVNSVGESDPLEAPNSIIAKNEFDEPDSPGKPAITDWDKDHVDLEWTPPKSDGGSPITGYIIQKKEKGSPYWVNAASAPAGKTSGSVPDLTPGQDYEFRVIAVNKAGPSEPSEPSDVVTAKERYLAPKIKTPLNDVRIKAGQIIHVDIDFIGEPIPEVIWTISGNPIKTDERTTLTAIGYHTIVHTVNAKRSDSGTYNLMLRNSSGIDEGSFQVVVLDRPGPPEAPLEYEEITAQSVTLSWKPPKDNGGSEITAYVIEKKDVTHGGGWVPAVAYVNPKYNHATVPRLIEGTKYEFRVFAENLQGRSDPLVTAKPVVAKNQFDVPGRPGKPDAVDSDKDHIKIKWTPPISNGGSPILGYEVERRDRMTGRWVKLTKEPTKHLEYYDDRVTEGHQYEYRVTAVNAAGPGKPSDTSNLWMKVSSFVRGCHYDVIGLEPNKKYNFRVRAENQYGLSEPLETDSPIMAKFPFTVPDPPGQPRILDWDSTNITLMWDRPRHDGGARIQGYKVEYRDVVEDQQWRIANDYLVKDTTYIVHGLLQGREYEFRVRAKNAAGFSKPSSPSSKFKLKSKFDVPSPPGTPKVVKVGKNYVDLKWEAPKSDGGSRITGYIIEKREVGGAFWVKCNDYNVTDTEYTVLNLIEKGDYEFRIFAVNAAGKSEPSSCTTPVKICEVEGGIKPEFVRPLTTTSVALGKQLVWECEASGRPTPTSRWLKNGREVTMGGRFRSEQINGVFRLVISEVRDGDEGDYVCEASNAVGSITCSARLKIGSPPRIDRMPGDLYLPEGDNTKVKIFYSGDQPMEVVLSKDGKAIVETTHIKYTVFDEYLIIFIKEINKSDAGNYTLSCKNDSGSVSASFTIHITGLPGPPIGPLDVSDISKHTCTLNWRPPQYDGGMKITHYVVERRDISLSHWITVSSFCKDTTFVVQGLTEGQEYLFRVMAANENGMGPPLEGTNPIKAKAPYDPPSAPGTPKVIEVGGDFVNLSWDKPESDGGSRIQGYWVDKREAGTQAWQRVNAVLCITPQINISNLIEDRQYEFRVFAQNEAGLSPPSTASTSVKIKDPMAAKPPEIVQPLKRAMAIQYKNAEFQCKITGTPKPTITWYKGAREITQGSKYRMLQEGETYSLVIHDVYGEDADEYVCRAANKGGFKSTRAELVIMTPPKLNVPPRFRDTAFFDKGENVVIKIPFTGIPKPKITWVREGETIESGGHYAVERKERHAILTIRDGSKIDSGPYRVTAENDLGMDSAIIKIQISDRPDPPRFPAVENIGHDSLALTWKPPMWDGGSNITNYLVEKREHPMTSWIRVGNTRFNTMAITGLSPGHQYEFRVYAENVYGRSDPSAVSELITTKDTGKKVMKKKQYEVDEHGKKIRGRADDKVKDYDQYVFDIYSKYVPQPVDIKTSSVYDYYDILEEIGTGAFGVVHRCRERKTGNIFAAKFIPVSHMMEKELIRKEIDIMNQLHHPKLINLHDAFEDDDEMVLIFEFLSGGELFERITAEGYTMSESEVINYMRQICEGVKHMHEKNIIHLDIKPENIMCQTRNSTNVKLIDFGLATKLDPNEVVKISTGTAEFAAPEIVEREPVGFYTDMWAVGVLAYVLLSGLSPFAGENDIETLKNVKACDWDFDEEAFSIVSEEGKDFIRRLLVKNKEKRMTAHECLQHAWLTGDHSNRTSPISQSRYANIRDKIRAKYPDWDAFVLPIGRISEYSSLRKLLVEKYKIHDTYFDRRQAAPRFVIKPQSTFAYEGQSAKFSCRVIAIATPTLTWFHNNAELRQSVKFMKRYNGDDYTFIINRVKLDDRGEYVIRAENHYGYREEVVKWFKERRELTRYEYTMTHADGVITMEIVDCKPEDSGKYRCVATNIHGSDETSCVVIVEGVGETAEQAALAHNLMYSGDRRYIEPPSRPAPPAPVTVRTSHTSSHQSSSYSSSSTSKYASSSQQTTLKSSAVTEALETSERRPIKKYGAKLDTGSPSRSRSATKELILPPDDSLMCPPSFTEKLSNMSVKDGEQLNLKCTVKGDPDPQVTWFKNGQPLSSSDVIDLKYKNGIATLTINEVFPEDEGNYVCKATNTKGSTETSCTLKVIPMDAAAAGKGKGGDPPPKIVSHLTSMFVKDGEPVTLSCRIIGAKKFDVIWLHNNKEIKPSKDFQYDNEANIYKLNIAEIFPEDSGTYTCEAFNDAGESFSSCTLNVLVPNEEPKSPVFKTFPQSATVQEGESAIFECEIEKVPLKVTWLKDGKPVDEESSKYKFTMDGKKKFKFEITNCSAIDVGQYTAKAIGKKGETMAAFALNVCSTGDQ